MSKKESNAVYRYTSLPRLLEILVTKRLPLLNSTNGTWKDKIDIGFIEACKKPNTNIGILCFTNEHATSFHWDLFTKENGVRIKFQKDSLKERMEGKNFVYRNVLYKSSKDIKELLKKYQKSDSLPIKDFAFLKRTQYEAEKEWRIVCERKNAIDNRVVTYLPISLSDIKSITFSPYYRDYNERMILRKALQNLWISKGGKKDDLKIYHSSLFNNKSIEKILESNGNDDIEET